MERADPALDHEAVGEAADEKAREGTMSVYGTVPLALRVAHVNEAHIGTERLGAARMGEELGTSDKQVYRLAEQLGIEQEGDGDARVFPAYALPVLEEEIHWRRHYRDLPPRLRIREIADLLGRSVADTDKRLARADVTPRTVRPDGGKPYRSYPKSVLVRFREEDMSVAPAHEWLSVGQLVRYSGYDRDWVLNRLRENGVEPEPRRSALTGRVSDHYPDGVLGLLDAAAADRPRHAGDWLTAEALTGLTGRSIAWVNRRLVLYADQAQTRQDDNGNARMHYPVAVGAALVRISQEQHMVEPKGDNLSRKELSRAVGRTAFWVDERLRELGVEPEPRRSRTGRVFDSFPRGLAEVLGEISRRSRNA